jgi:hypothetical protein
MSRGARAAAVSVLLFGAVAQAFGAIVLRDNDDQIDPGKPQWVRFEITQRPGTVRCQFQAMEGGKLRAELFRQSELEAIGAPERYSPLAKTDSMPTGGFSQYLEQPGYYVVMIENTGDRPVNMHWNVVLAVGAKRPVSRYLSPERRLTVILVSFISFFAIVTFSARALLRAMGRL